MDKYIQNIGVNARNASHKLSYVTTNQKNDFLEILAKAIKLRLIL
jgi:gamma-glutamyl phosphate reductase